MNNKVKFLRGTATEYEAATKDNDTFYYTTDTEKLYLGDKEITGGGVTIDDTLSDTSEHPVQNKVIKAALDEKASIEQGRKADTAVQSISIDGVEQTKNNGNVNLPKYPTSLPANGGNAATVNSHTVESDVPADAKFTDTVYIHPTSGVAAGSYKSVTVDNKGHITSGSNPTTLSGYGITDAAAKSHTHDDRYYTESEVNTKLNAKLDTSLKGAENGLAELDSSGKVPTSQLPSYVDDVIEGYLYNSKFYKESTHTTEIASEAGKIYIDLSNNKTYRWSGSAFVVISETLALGETSATAYRGDRGLIAYNHSQSAHAPSNAEANVQADWDETDTASDAYIKNKPTSLPANGGTASKANTLSTARTIQTNLESTSSESFDGSKNVTPGVTGTLPIANGGTGATTASAALTALGAAASSHTHSAYVNQNAFSNVVVGSTTVAADTATDTLTLVGNNVTLTPDTTNDKITIGITKANVTSALGYTPPISDTTYSNATTSSAGLMSAADKAKLDTIEEEQILIVGENSKYTTITSAINEAISKKLSYVIYILPGTYIESLDLTDIGDISLTLIGIGQVSVSSSAAYPYAALYGMGNIKVYNISFFSSNSYALHIEFGNKINSSYITSKIMEFHNCVFGVSPDSSWQCAGIGMGAKNYVAFHNCIFQTEFYCHNQKISNISDQHLSLNGCQIYGNLRVDDAATSNSASNSKMLLSFNGNGITGKLQFIKNTGTMTAVDYIPSSDANFTLDPLSGGNNVAGMNCDSHDIYEKKTFSVTANTTTEHPDKWILQMANDYSNKNVMVSIQSSVNHDWVIIGQGELLGDTLFIPYFNWYTSAISGNVTVIIRKLGL